jgi:hypothetical protein
MDQRVISIAPSRVGGRQQLVRILMSGRRLTLAEASHWCDAWDEHAARSGIRPSVAPHYWDSARGWIDAQLDGEPMATGGASTRTATPASGRRP